MIIGIPFFSLSFGGLIDNKGDARARRCSRRRKESYPSERHVHVRNTVIAVIRARERANDDKKEGKTTEEVDGGEEQKERRSPRNDGDLRCHTEGRRRPFSRTRRKRASGRLVFQFSAFREIFSCVLRERASPCVPSFPLTSSTASLFLPFRAPILFYST